ncbi:MAG: hypothetical protein ABI778_10955 [Ignavibacteriota bacterium]
MKLLKLYRMVLLCAGIILPAAGNMYAQNFREDESLWKSEVVRSTSSDSIILEKHSFFSVPTVNDSIDLVYHEPMPDSVMPKAAIEIGLITIQASSAEDVIALLEAQARKSGADWIVGFSEPRRKFSKDGNLYYRSEALLYKVINPDLVPESQIVQINCDDNRLHNCAAIESFVKQLVAKSGD